VKFFPSGGIDPSGGRPSGKISKVTENAGIQLAEARQRDQEKIARTLEEIENLQEKTLKIEILVDLLGEEEKFVILKYYLAALPWYVITSDYQKTFGSPISRISLKRKKKKALKAMAETRDRAQEIILI